MIDRTLNLAVIVFLAAMGGVWVAASHPAAQAPVTAQGTFRTADLLVDNTSTFSAMTASTMMTVNASKQLTPYAGATLSNDGGATVCSLAAGGTGNCNLAVVGGGTTNHIPIIQSAPPNNRSIGDSPMVYNTGSNLDVASVKITSVSDPNASTDQTAATAHWITSSSASNFSATQGGTVVSPGAATGKFLRDDNSWQTVAASSGLYGGVITTVPTRANTGFTNTWCTKTGHTVTNGSRGISQLSGTNSATNWLGISRPAPTPPYTIQALVAPTNSNAANSGLFGFGWSNSTDCNTPGASEMIIVTPTSTSSGFNPRVATSAGSGGVSFIVNAAGPISLGSAPYWVQLTDDGTNVTIGWSTGGDSYVTLLSTAKSAGFLGSNGYSNIIWQFGDNASVNMGYDLIGWKCTGTGC